MQLQQNIVWHMRDTRKRESVGSGWHSWLKNVTTDVNV